MRRSALALLVGLGVVARPASACTTFLLESGGARLFGKSYDWDMGQALVLVNKSGVAKQALTTTPADVPARWRSKHASVTFNQYGRELPNGGMNDAGLVVEVMWLDSSRPPRPDARPALSELQWIQYQLDRFGSVAEMVAAAETTRVSLIYGKVHYLACDRGGACAAFEHVDGRLVVVSGDALRFKCLTNDTYADSLSHLARQTHAPTGAGSLDRFARVARATTRPAGVDPLATAFDVLSSVSGPRSQWSIVYDLSALRVHFRTLRRRAIRSVDLTRFEPSCADAVKSLDIDVGAAGDVTALFTSYDAETNRRLVERSLRDLRGRLPRGTVDRLATYPSTTTCEAPPRQPARRCGRQSAQSP